MINAKIITFIGENIGISIHDFGFGSGFLGYNIKNLNKKEVEINMLNFLKHQQNEKSTEAGRKCLPAMHTATKQISICLTSTWNDAQSLRKQWNFSEAAWSTNWNCVIKTVEKKYWQSFLEISTFTYWWDLKKIATGKQTVVLQADKRIHQYSWTILLLNTNAKE